MVLTLRGASGQNAQRHVVEERACAIAPAPTLQHRTGGRLVWIRDWAQNLKLKCATYSLVQVSRLHTVVGTRRVLRVFPEDLEWPFNFGLSSVQQKIIVFFVVVSLGAIVVLVTAAINFHNFSLLFSDQTKIFIFLFVPLRYLCYKQTISFSKRVFEAKHNDKGNNENWNKMRRRQITSCSDKKRGCFHKGFTSYIDKNTCSLNCINWYCVT